jgi:hypothetical protein
MLNALKMDMIKQGKPVLLTPRTLDDVKFQNGKEVLNTSVRDGMKGVEACPFLCMIAEEQPILLKELGTKPVFVCIAQCNALSVFGS